MSKKLLFSKDFPTTSGLVYHTWDKNVPQLCSRSLLLYLNGFFLNPLVAKCCSLIGGGYVICVHTWDLFLFLVYF